MPSNSDVETEATRMSVKVNHNNCHCHISTATPGSSPPKASQAILDTGSSGHFFAIKAPLVNVTKATTPIKVELPDHRTMKSTHQGELPIFCPSKVSTKSIPFPSPPRYIPCVRRSTMRCRMQSHVHGNKMQSHAQR